MEHDISFRRNGKVVELRIATDLPYHGAEESYILFSNEYTSETEAELRVRYFRDRHQAAMQKIRQAEFRSGWKHAKAKKRGRASFDWFMGNFKTKASHV
jgi:hypothetical protein